MLHLPDGPSAGSALVLHGYGGDPAQPHIVETCAALAGAGVAALRFAYRDHRPPRMTLATATDDAKGALRLLRAHPEVKADRVAIVGFSFGGAVAALVAGSERPVRAVVLAAATSESQGADRPLQAIARTKARVLLLWGTNDTEVPTAHAERYRAALAAAGVAHRFETVDGGDHDFDPPDARRRMADRVAGWVRESF